ncbi:hypothetical protein HHI36_012068 [Cryptolaemus montrouzieri]|uniref:EMI domain-containing protein n=1 Tax=Cryptolaemus montrouzieri TaxID=559131 RepID=A0ABD2NDK1_9CUCU
MCRAAGQYDANNPAYPLHKCDIYRSKDAGRILEQLMEKGSSLPWRETLFQATGESKLDGSAMRDYFRPLEEWLRNENLRTQEYVGWEIGNLCFIVGLGNIGMLIRLWILGITASVVLCELTGDHICEVEERYPVNVTEYSWRNATLRGYKWCMVFPPRCSFYTVKAVQVPEIVEKYETRVVKKCCPGFSENMKHDACVPCMKCFEEPAETKADAYAIQVFVEMIALMVRSINYF